MIIYVVPNAQQNLDSIHHLATEKPLQNFKITEKAVILDIRIEDWHGRKCLNNFKMNAIVELLY